MNAQLEISNVEASSTQVFPCFAKYFGLDEDPAVRGVGDEMQPDPANVHGHDHTVAARRIIWRAQDLQGIAPVICEGWAATIVMLPNGSRQITSFLLPGDLVSTTLLLETKPYCLVEAITDVRCHVFDRIELRSMLFRQPDLFDRFFKAWVDEKTRADELIVDLGRRTADERIARLILNLADRLNERGLVRGSPMEFDFPLRQHHIADATGLTPVHVSKVLTEFRRKNFISISERSLTILDEPGFRRVAHMR